MNSETKKDELRMSWNKKISLREIAQFYEDKLRELDAKQTKLMEDVNRKEAELESKMHILENSIEEAKDFIQNIDAFKKIIEDCLENSPRLADIENKVRGSELLWKLENKKFENLEDYLSNVHADLVQAVMHIATYYSFLQFVQDLAITAVQAVDMDLLRIELSISEDHASFDNVFLADARQHVKKILKTFRMFDPNNIPDDIVNDLALRSVKMFLDDIKQRLELLDKLEKIVEKVGAGNENGHVGSPSKLDDLI